MPVFQMQKSKLRSLLVLLAIAFVAALGAGAFNETIPSNSSTGSSRSHKQNLAYGSNPARFGNHSARDTTRPAPIALKPCSVHATYRNREKAFLPYEPVRDDVVPSLHEFTCRWAVGNDLSIDSTRLPKYVRPTGDSLRLGKDALAYAVQMRQRKEPPTSAQNTLYFVAEVGDSLYYKKIADSRPHSTAPTTVEVRSLRPLDVPKAETQYIWFEHEKAGVFRNDSTMRREEWRAHVFTYDRPRGIRYLQWTPIRYAEWKNDSLVGARQLDVRFPEAGLMEVEERFQRGAKVTRGMGWRHRIGMGVIDSTAIDD